MFTEQQTRDFYNSDDALYRSFWDRKGNCHWSCILNNHQTFSNSQLTLNAKMLSLSHIDKHSQALDLGCGNGVNTFYLHKKTGARITGIDLSDTRIENAKAALSKSNRATQQAVTFLRTSATQLPFSKNSFTHVWSQATIYHIHNKMRALREIHRVLKPGGIFIFDDLIKPRQKVSVQARRHVYDRLLFDTPFSFVSYQTTLEKIGFQILYAEELSQHLKRSYELLIKILKRKLGYQSHNKFFEKYRHLITAYRITISSIDRRDVGWALYVCKKV